MPDAARPFPWSIAAPFADREHHRPPRRADRLGPRRVRGARVEPARVAPVDLHEVDVPRGEAPRVDELARAAAGIPLAGAVARAGVETVAQLARVQVRRKAMHVRETPEVGIEVPVVGAQAAFPSIVDDDVAVADV